MLLVTLNTPIKWNFSKVRSEVFHILNLVLWRNVTDDSERAQRANFSNLDLYMFHTLNLVLRRNVTGDSERARHGRAH